MEITSAGFAHEGKLAQKWTCEGEDLSPPLVFREVPQEAAALVLIVDDPDAPMGTFVHWVLYDLPPTTTELAEGFPHRESFTDGTKQGLSDFGKVGYSGPCPPPGKPHRYFFRLFALSQKLELPPKQRKKDVEKAMEGKVLSSATLMGTYQR